MGHLDRAPRAVRDMALIPLDEANFLYTAHVEMVVGDLGKEVSLAGGPSGRKDIELLSTDHSRHCVDQIGQMGS